MIESLKAYAQKGVNIRGTTYISEGQFLSGRAPCLPAACPNPRARERAAVRKTKQFLLLCAAFLFACGLLIFPQTAAAGAKNGIGYCLQILVPSLYPFMVLAVFIVKSGIAERIGRLLERPARAVLKLPGCTAPAVFMSMIGGYPTGARSVEALAEAGAISEAQAVRMLGFCVNAGPAFVISAVGSGFLKSTQAGIILFASQILASLLLGIFQGFTAGRKRRKAPRERRVPPESAVDALIASAADAARAMLSMCCFVVLFAALMNLLRLWLTTPLSAGAASALLEVTGGCADLSRLKAPLWAVSFAVGWGGVCVHFQVISSLRKIRVRLPRFFLFRFLHGMLAAAVTYGLLKLFPISAEAFSNTSSPLSGTVSGSVPAAAALMVLCAAFVFSLSRERLEIAEGGWYNKKKSNRYGGGPN